MLQLLLLLAVVVGHPPRISSYPWQLMVGREVEGSITWTEKERFLEGRACAEEAQRYKIAECVRDPDLV